MANRIATKRPFPSGIYRRLRRGLSSLPQMEADLVRDMRHVSDQVSTNGMSDFWQTFAIEAVSTVLDEITELEVSFGMFRRFLAPHVLDGIDSLQLTMEEYLTDVPQAIRQEFLLIVRGYGSVGEMLDDATRRLGEKREALSAALTLISEDKADSIRAATDILEVAILKMQKEPYPTYEGPLHSWEQIVEKWRQALEDARQKVENAGSYWERQAAESDYWQLMRLICHMFPHDHGDGETIIVPRPGRLAEALGLGDVCERLDRNELVCMIIAGPVFCAVVMLIAIMCSRDCPG